MDQMVSPMQIKWIRVVRKNPQSRHVCFTLKTKIDVGVLAKRPRNGPWALKVLTQWAGKQFLGGCICLKTSDSNKQHSSYMVWLAKSIRALPVE